MSINKRIASIPFPVIFIVLAFLVSWDFLFTFVSLTSNPQAYESNPVNAFLVTLFGPEYFVLALPIVLALLYTAAKTGKWLLAKLEKPEHIKGDNHIAMLLVLLVLPNALHQMVQVFFGKRLVVEANFNLWLPLGVAIALIYIGLTEYDLWKLKKNRVIHAHFKSKIQK